MKWCASVEQQWDSLVFMTLKINVKWMWSNPTNIWSKHLTSHSYDDLPNPELFLRSNSSHKIYRSCRWYGHMAPHYLTMLKLKICKNVAFYEHSTECQLGTTVYVCFENCLQWKNGQLDCSSYHDDRGSCSTSVSRKCMRKSEYDSYQPQSWIVKELNPSRSAWGANALSTRLPSSVAFHSLFFLLKQTNVRRKCSILSIHTNFSAESNSFLSIPVLSSGINFRWKLSRRTKLKKFLSQQQ